MKHEALAATIVSGLEVISGEFYTLKAIRYGEELTQAMEARCFVGEYVKSSQSFTWKDWLALIGLVAVILGQIMLGG